MIQFSQPKSLSEVKFATTGGKLTHKTDVECNMLILYYVVIARKIIIEGSKQASCSDFVKIGESKELPQKNAGL